MGQIGTVQHDLKLKPPVTNTESLLLSLKTGVNSKSQSNYKANQIESNSNECILNSLIENIDIQLDDGADDDNGNLQHETLRQIGRMESDNNDDDFTINVSAVLDSNSIPQQQPSLLKRFEPRLEHMEIDNIEISGMAVDIIQEDVLLKIEEGEFVESKYFGSGDGGHPENVEDVFERVENDDEFNLNQQAAVCVFGLKSYKKNLFSLNLCFLRTLQMGAWRSFAW